jgi:hypothetical protein
LLSVEGEFEREGEEEVIVARGGRFWLGAVMVEDLAIETSQFELVRGL